MFVHVFLDLISNGLLDHGKNEFYQVKQKVFLTFFSFPGLDLFSKYKHDHVESHGSEITTLEEITTADAIPHNTVATLYLNNKYHIRLSSIPFELFIQYLQDNKYLNLQRIVHRHLNIHIITGKLTPASAGGSSEEGIIETHPPTEEFHEVDPENPDQDTDMEMNRVKEENTMDAMNLDDMTAHT